MFSPKVYIGLLYAIPDKIAYIQARGEIEKYFFHEKLPLTELKEILSHHTRLTKSVRLQEMIIWRGNKGYLSAAYSKASRELQKTLTISLQEADLMDKRDDEYDPKILWTQYEKGTMDFGAYLQKLQKYMMLNNAIINLRKLLFRRFEKKHPEIFKIYKEGRAKVEKAQEKDKETHARLLQGDLKWIRDEYGDGKTENSVNKIKNISEGKLAPIAETATIMNYIASGGKNTEIEFWSRNFWSNATAVSQLTYEDYPELEENIEKLDTNPIIIAAICSGIDKVDKKNVIKFLMRNPRIIDKWPTTYIGKMKESLRKIKKHNFNFRDHRAIAEIVETIVEKEKTSLKQRYRIG
jgi:hypothetical protein